MLLITGLTLMTCPWRNGIKWIVPLPVTIIIFVLSVTGVCMKHEYHIAAVVLIDYLFSMVLTAVLVFTNNSERTVH